MKKNEIKLLEEIEILKLENEKLLEIIQEKHIPYSNLELKKNIVKKIAIKLREKGFSIRQIMVLLDYKSPQSISILLKKGE